MLDGLLHNESSIEILEHATDTAGATEMIFAMPPQYGYRLTPRIRNLGDRKLSVIGPSADYAPLAPLIGGTVYLAIVEENWDEMLRLWASIAAGLVPPSVILKKLPLRRAKMHSPRRCGRSAASNARSLSVIGSWTPPCAAARMATSIRAKPAISSPAPSSCTSSASCGTASPKPWPTVPAGLTSSSTPSSYGTPSI